VWLRFRGQGIARNHVRTIASTLAASASSQPLRCARIRPTAGAATAKESTMSDTGGGIESHVEGHYSRDDLERLILDALARSGKDLERLQPEDLAPVDEFHSGGRQATADLAVRLAFSPEMHVLDVGCGIGGPSRYLAATCGCRVTGIDLTASYVATAAALSQRVGLGDRVAYRQASALALPFAAESFDGGCMMHVGMNIADKPALFREVRRVLKHGAVFGVYDIMRTAEGDIAYPVHWAQSAQTSFVAGTAAYREALDGAGFDVTHERGRRDLALKVFREAKARAAAGGPPPLGLHLLMKTDVPQKLANLLDAMEHGIVAPVEMICRAR
jgi:ubiquinone/menaquinone biosynthesis C-methylase UbiE